MQTDSPLIAFVKALARRQARLDLQMPPPANDDVKKDQDKAKKQ
ncbi:hypothetical protein [Pararhizobium qamdonense]|nr:hypothetical protein [Pararhizobium qamdonense]